MTSSLGVKNEGIFASPLCKISTKKQALKQTLQVPRFATQWAWQCTCDYVRQQLI